MKRFLQTLLLGCLAIGISAQDFMMQGWYWDYPKDGCNGFSGNHWAVTLQNQVSTLGNAGFTYMWLPPMVRASFGSCSNGYDPQDLYDLGGYGQGPTGLGTETEVANLIGTLASNGIQTVADVVYNHRDGGSPEANSAVKDYITQYYNSDKSPFPPDRYRCVIPIGSGSVLGEGDYYFKIRSKTYGFSGYGYKVYMTTNRKSGDGYLGSVNETEPNDGSGCGDADAISLNTDMVATLDNANCSRDEFYLHLSNTDFYAAGDQLIIYLNNTGGYSDHFIYGIYYDEDGAGPVPGFDVDVNALIEYQTYTNFFGLPSGQGGMNFESFKPNSVNASTTYLNGFWDGLWFFYDYDQSRGSTQAVLNEWTKWLLTDVGVQGLRMDAVKHFDPAFVGQLMDYLAQQVPSITPPMVVGEYYDGNPYTLRDWVNAVYSNMNTSSANIRTFDFALREALKNACDNGSADVRGVFSSGLVDATGMSGFNSVTFVNNHDFRDEGQPVNNDPMLAYAYILTNNKVGIPCVFYPDYFGSSVPHYPVVNLQGRINALMALHQQYIYGGSVEYLNRFGTTRSSDYLVSGPDKALIYQIKGGIGGKDVIVAINFAYTQLRVDHEINSAGAPVGTQFDDVLGYSNFPYAVVASSSPGGVPNSIFIDLPARSYSVWVQGATALPAELTNFEVKPVDDDEVQINWETAVEVNVDFFELERRIGENGTFEALDRLASKGNEVKGAHYQYLDRTAPKGIRLYYRLKTQDEDGKWEYSTVRNVILPTDSRARLYPNPFKEELTIQFPNETDGDVVVINTLGQHISTMPYHSRQKLIMDTRNWKSGLYLVYQKSEHQLSLLGKVIKE